MLIQISSDSIKSLAHHFTTYSDIFSAGYGSLFSEFKFPSNQQYLEIISFMAGYKTYAALLKSGCSEFKLNSDRERLTQFLKEFKPDGLNKTQTSYWVNYAADGIREALSNFEHQAIIRHFKISSDNFRFSAYAQVLFKLLHSVDFDYSKNYVLAMNLASNIFSKAYLGFDENGPGQHIIRLKEIFAKKPSSADIQFIQQLVDVLIKLKMYTSADFGQLQNLPAANLLEVEITLFFGPVYNGYYKDNHSTEAQYNLLQQLEQQHLSSLLICDTLQLYSDGEYLWDYLDIMSEALENLLMVDLPLYLHKPECMRLPVKLRFEQRVKEQVLQLNPVNNLDMLGIIADDKLNLNQRIRDFNPDAKEIDVDYENLLFNKDLERIEQFIIAFKEGFAPQYQDYSFELEIGFKNPAKEFIESMQAEGIYIPDTFHNEDMPNEEILTCVIRSNHNGQYAGMVQLDEGELVYVCPFDEEAHYQALEYIENYLKKSYIRNLKPVKTPAIPEIESNFEDFNPDNLKGILDGRRIGDLNQNEHLLLNLVKTKGRKIGLSIILQSNVFHMIDDDQKNEVPYQHRFIHPNDTVISITTDQ